MCVRVREREREMKLPDFTGYGRDLFVSAVTTLKEVKVLL